MVKDYKTLMFCLISEMTFILGLLFCYFHCFQESQKQSRSGTKSRLYQRSRKASRNMLTAVGMLKFIKQWGNVLRHRRFHVLFKTPKT